MESLCNRVAPGSVRSSKIVDFPNQRNITTKQCGNLFAKQVLLIIRIFNGRSKTTERTSAPLLMMTTSGSTAVRFWSSSTSAKGTAPVGVLLCLRLFRSSVAVRDSSWANCSDLSVLNPPGTAITMTVRGITTKLNEEGSGRANRTIFTENMQLGLCKQAKKQTESDMPWSKTKKRRLVAEKNR